MVKHWQVIALDEFYINALSAIGIAKEDVPVWLRQLLNEWEHFNLDYNITRQIKGLLLLNIVSQLGGDTSCFYQ